MASKRATKLDKMAKCKTCNNMDIEKSNANWVVCPMIPLEVLAGKSADDCNNYKARPNIKLTGGMTEESEK